MPKEKKDKKLDDDILKNTAPQEGEAEVVNQPVDEDETDQEEQVLEVEQALEDDAISLTEKLDLVKAAWEASETKAAEYLDGWQRAKAELSNYIKRVNRDREQYNKDAVGNVVRNYLPVLDDLERALKDRSKDNAAESWANGIELIYRKLASTLENDGVTRIEAEGAMFDPNLHEAVAQINSPDHQSGQIVDVIQTGYRIGERVLRPARVAIAA